MLVIYEQNINIIITQNMKYYKCTLTIFCLSSMDAILSGIFIRLQSFLIFICASSVASCLLNPKIEPTTDS